ncbi:MAG: hypothetical protein JWN62_3671 [Acidimicrobiales bacterium]|nr:hypothetical protein [Acidimicrobiales bacterium]
MAVVCVFAALVASCARGGHRDPDDAYFDEVDIEAPLITQKLTRGQVIKLGHLYCELREDGTLTEDEVVDKIVSAFADEPAKAEQMAATMGIAHRHFCPDVG